MGIDIKFPIGLMFAIFGVILIVFGLITGSNVEMYKKSLDININLWTGIFMAVFGAFMLFTSIKSKKKG